MGAVAVGQHAADGRAECPLEGNQPAVQHRHLDAQLGRRRGHLGPDEASSDDHEPGSRHELLLEPERVGRRPQDVHTGRCGERQEPRRRSGRQHERVPTQLFAVSCGRRARVRVDGRDPAAEPQLDPLVTPERVPAELEVVELALTCEEVLRQGGTLVGRHRLVADQHEVALVPLGAERLGAAGAGETGAHDEDRARGGHAASASVTMIAAIGQPAAASSTFGSSDSPRRTVAVPLSSSSKISAPSRRRSRSRYTATGRFRSCTWVSPIGCGCGLGTGLGRLVSTR